MESNEILTQVTPDCAILGFAPDPGASPEAIAKLVEKCGPLPQDYLDLLSRFDGIEGRIVSDDDGGDWLALFPVELVISLSEDEDWQTTRPNLVWIGSDGGSEWILVDRSGASGLEYVQVPAIDMGHTKPGDGIEFRCSTLAELLEFLKHFLDE